MEWGEWHISDMDEILRSVSHIIGIPGQGMESARWIWWGHRWWFFLLAGEKGNRHVLQKIRWFVCSCLIFSFWIFIISEVVLLDGVLTVYPNCLIQNITHYSIKRKDIMRVIGRNDWNFLLWVSSKIVYIFSGKLWGISNIWYKDPRIGKLNSYFYRACLDYWMCSFLFFQLTE